MVKKVPAAVRTTRLLSAGVMLSGVTATGAIAVGLSRSCHQTARSPWVHANGEFASDGHSHDNRGGRGGCGAVAPLGPGGGGSQSSTRGS